MASSRPLLQSLDNAQTRRQVTEMEHASYLWGLPTVPTQPDHPLALHHQTILRLTRLYELDDRCLDDLVIDYFQGQQTQVLLRERLKGRLAKPLMARADPSFCLKYSGTSARYLELFRSALDRDEPVAFANVHGFARFDPPPAFPAAHPLPPSRETSVGALSFYGFSLAAGSWYMQQLPIDVLGATLAAVAVIPPRPSEPWTVTGLRHELAAEAGGAGGVGDLADHLRRACTAFFTYHEFGHQLDRAHSPRTTAFLDRWVDSLDAVRCAGFPGDRQLGGWRRLCQYPSADPVDVLYLYGDLLANVAAFEAGLTTSEGRALRAYHWGFVAPEGPRSRPRGNIALLTAPDDDVVGHGLALVEDVLSAPPEERADRMRANERAAWTELHRRVTGEA